jgi:hypothetical protein
VNDIAVRKAKTRVKDGLQEWIGKIDRELSKNCMKFIDLQQEQRALKRQKYEIAKLLKDFTIS